MRHFYWLIVVQSLNITGATFANITSTGIHFSANCVQASLNTTISADPKNVTNVFGVNGSCFATVSFDPSQAYRSSGVVAVDARSCDLPAAVLPELLPVMFWFAQQGATDNTYSFLSYICRPAISPVIVEMYFQAPQLLVPQNPKTVSPLVFQSAVAKGNYSSDNDVFGAPNSRAAVNG